MVKLKSLLYSIPVAAALSFLPMKQANAQITKSDCFSNMYAKGDQKRIERKNANILRYSIGRLSNQDF